MSDFDRNVAADRGGYAGSAVAIDAGLRAHMIRVYNYMASAVALTGVVAYLTFTMSVVTNSAGAVTGFTPLGQFLFGGLFMWVLMLAPLAMVFFLSFRINSLRCRHRALAVLRLCRHARRVACDHLHRLHASLDRARVLHLGGRLRCVEPVRLHHQARPVGDGLVHDHGPDRPHHREPGQPVPEVERSRLRDLGRSAFWCLPA